MSGFSSFFFKKHTEKKNDGEFIEFEETSLLLFANHSHIGETAPISKHRCSRIGPVGQEVSIGPILEDAGIKRG